MLDARNKRKIRAQSRNKQSEKSQEQSGVSKNTLQRLSLSFYGEETIKKQKQIIFDDYNMFDDLPIVAEALRKKHQKVKKNEQDSHRACSSKKKPESLKMEKYFFQEKYDEMDIVPTNASHYDPKQHENSIHKKKHQKRPTSMKNRNVTSEMRIFNKSGLSITARSRTSCKTKKKPLSQNNKHHEQN